MINDINLTLSIYLQIIHIVSTIQTLKGFQSRAPGIENLFKQTRES